jgi:hypothetical protein
MGEAPILAERAIAATSRDQTVVSTTYRRLADVIHYLIWCHV